MMILIYRVVKKYLHVLACAESKVFYSFLRITFDFMIISKVQRPIPIQVGSATIN
jgi:hypothetical protein